jgi:carbon storage regulator CsrA
MLVLTRSEEESILIDTTDGEIEIKMVRITKKGGNKAVIGITAPQKCLVLRKELSNGCSDGESSKSNGQGAA